MWKSFVCAMTAAVVLKALDPFRTGETALYHVKYSTEWHNFEAVGPFLVLGFLGVSQLQMLPSVEVTNDWIGNLRRSFHQT